MSVRVAINGFGSIGRRVMRHALRRDDVQVVAVNDLANIDSLIYLLKHDSTFGPLGLEVEQAADHFRVGGQEVRVLSERNPQDLPWDELGVEVVVEATGVFRDGKKASAHLDAGAQRVIISAPATNEDQTIVMGVNQQSYDPDQHRVVSNASCTTNCLAPVAKVLDDTFGIRRGLMTTVHSYTTSQAILDLPHKDPRRGRTAAENIVPTSTGAAVAVGLVLPQLDGKLDGMAFRVPTPAVSTIDLTAELEETAQVEEINEAFRAAASGPLEGILAVSDEPLVSTDFRGDPHSATVDLPLTAQVGGSLVKVIAWYDNEWGYSARLLDLACYMHSQE